MYSIVTVSPSRVTLTSERGRVDERSSRDFPILGPRSVARILRVVVTGRRGLVLAPSFPFVHLAIKP